MIKYLILRENRTGETVALSVAEISTICQKENAQVKITMNNNETIMVDGRIEEITAQITEAHELAFFPPID
ncbi:hypothetical protein JMG10_07665 [Nostoc ellipsosporum NOK]|nr:hypothetical protein [Nostoc ellipsosporum NOK]